MLLHLGRGRDRKGKATRILAVKGSFYLFQLSCLVLCLYGPSLLIFPRYVQSYNPYLNNYNTVEDILTAQPPNRQDSVKVEYRKASKHRKFNPTIYQLAQDEIIQKQYHKYSSTFDPFSGNHDTFQNTINHAQREKRREKYIEHKLGDKVEVTIEYNSRQSRRRAKEEAAKEKEFLYNNMITTNNPKDQIQKEETLSAKKKKRFFPDAGSKRTFFQFLFGRDMTKTPSPRKLRYHNNVINEKGEKIYTKDIDSLYDLIITFFDELFYREHLLPGIFLAFLVTILWLLNKARFYIYDKSKMDKSHEDGADIFTDFLSSDLYSNEIHDYSMTLNEVGCNEKMKTILTDIKEGEDVDPIYRVENWIQFNDEFNQYQKQYEQYKKSFSEGTSKKPSMTSDDLETPSSSAQISSPSSSNKTQGRHGYHYLSKMEEGVGLRGGIIKPKHVSFTKTKIPSSSVYNKNVTLKCCSNLKDDNYRENSPQEETEKITKLSHHYVQTDNCEDQQINQHQTKRKYKKSPKDGEFSQFHYKRRLSSFSQSKLVFKLHKTNGKSRMKKGSQIEAAPKDFHRIKVFVEPTSIKSSSKLQRKHRRDTNQSCTIQESLKKKIKKYGIGSASCPAKNRDQSLSRSFTKIYSSTELSPPGGNENNANEKEDVSSPEYSKKQKTKEEDVKIKRSVCLS